MVRSASFASRILPVMALSGLIISSPASAQLGGLFKNKSEPSSNSGNCSTKSNNSIGKSILGGVIGSVTNSATSRMGAVGTFVPRAEVAGVLTNAIACRLDPEEQVQAADATLEATRGEEVGSSSNWQSNTRDNVSGSSTVTQKTALNDGTSCMNVTDVVIVEGEETTVSKRMCKSKGQAKYVIMV